MNFHRFNRCIAGCSLVAAWLLTALAASADTPPLQICLLSGSAEYQSEKSLAEFQSYLEKNYQVVCHRAFGKDKGDDLPGLEALDNSDLMIVFTRRIKLPPVQLDRIKKYLASGRAVIGLRTASHAFENYMEFDREVFGGDYKGHYTDEEAQVRLAPGRAGHPVLAGVGPFATRKVYKNPALADDTIVLLDATMASYREPVAWTRARGGGRVFYTSLGTPEDFAQESFRRLLVNAVFWTTQRDEAASRRASDALKR